ncbi:pseudouridine synthase [Irpex lacteus]|nr:pseudouridine synthase [Irpex lacteus]
MLAASRSTVTTAYKTLPTIPRWRSHAIYIDRGVLVINKPSGLASQPGPSSVSTVHPGVSSLDVLKSKSGFAEDGHLPWPCHRLDKRTTGALLCGRNPSIQRDLHAQFASGDVERRYLAILRGGDKSFKKDEFVVRTLLEAVDGSVRVPKEGEPVSAEGKRQWGETTVRVLASSPVAPLTLVELEAKTGRRHQLRVHAAHIGAAPILGDSRYASSKLSPQIAGIMKAFEAQQEDANAYATRYRSSGAHKRLRLGIRAPLPSYFVELCQLFALPLPEECMMGGVYVDGQKQENGEVEDLEGRWRG